MTLPPPRPPRSRSRAGAAQDARNTIDPVHGNSRIHEVSQACSMAMTRTYRKAILSVAAVLAIAANDGLWRRSDPMPSSAYAQIVAMAQARLGRTSARAPPALQNYGSSLLKDPRLQLASYRAAQLSINSVIHALQSCNACGLRRAGHGYAACVTLRAGTCCTAQEAEASFRQSGSSPIGKG